MEKTRFDVSFACSRHLLALAAALAVVLFAPAARGGGGLNIDLGITYGTPASSYGAASGQAGSWNQAGLGVTALTDLTGAASSTSVNVLAHGDTSSWASASTDDELLLNDFVHVTSGASWNIQVSGLEPGDYLVFLYAPSHSIVGTGPMFVDGVYAGSLSGEVSAALVEGQSWMKVEATVTDGTLVVFGVSISGTSGLAGIQLVPLHHAAVNVDFGATFGVPAAGYGAASGQAGAWNKIGLGVTALSDLSGSHSGTSLHLAASSDSGGTSGHTTDDELLLNDNFYNLNGTTWSVDLSGLAPGTYFVLLYAPSNSLVPTGDMTVEGIPVASIPGDTGATLIEGTSWVEVLVPVTDGNLSISGAGPDYSGLAGLQVVPIPHTGVNVDLGISHGVPSSSYGAASGQAGKWNMAGLGVTELLDLSGVPFGASASVASVLELGQTNPHITEDELLLNDNVYTLNGGTWTLDLTGLGLGDYFLVLYAPSHTSVPSGDMTVGGVPVASIPGDPGAMLIEGTSWVELQLTITDGTLAISGVGATYSGLAGFQLVPLRELESYCTAGPSASGCTASISATGNASATNPSGFVLSATDVEGAKDGLFFFGSNGRQAKPWGNGGSYQCVVPPVKRCGLLFGVGTTGLCDGAFTQDLNARWTAKPPHNPGAGAVVQAQLWYRDPWNTSNQTTSLSDAIEFVVGP